MRKMDVAHATDAVTGMLTLQATLINELDHVEVCIDELTALGKEASYTETDDLNVYCTARTALYSGLASTNELLGWINVMTEKDNRGSAVDVIELLPMPTWSIH